MQIGKKNITKDRTLINKNGMEKATLIIVILIAFIASGCGQTKNNQENEIEQNNGEKLPFSATDSQSCTKDTILCINKTCLIEILPDEQHFDDENSEEAQDYYTAMDDWSWYIVQTRERFEKMGIKSIATDKRYLSFILANNEKMIIDTKKEYNGERVNALLYKKGHAPIIIHIIYGDNDENIINEYLNK